MKKVFTAVAMMAASTLALADAEISAAQQELSKLGYKPGQATGAMNDDTRQALRTFQADNELETSGALDKKTRFLLLGGQFSSTSSTPSGIVIDDSIDSGVSAGTTGEVSFIEDSAPVRSTTITTTSRTTFTSDDEIDLLDDEDEVVGTPVNSSTYSTSRSSSRSTSSRTRSTSTARSTARRAAPTRTAARDESISDEDREAYEAPEAKSKVRWQKQERKRATSAVRSSKWGRGGRISHDYADLSFISADIDGETPDNSIGIDVSYELLENIVVRGKMQRFSDTNPDAQLRHATLEAGYVLGFRGVDVIVGGGAAMYDSSSNDAEYGPRLFAEARAPLTSKLEVSAELAVATVDDDLEGVEFDIGAYYNIIDNVGVQLNYFNRGYDDSFSGFEIGARIAF